MKKITTHLWYNKEATEAATFYTSVFPDSKINNVSMIRDTPSGDCDVVSFQLSGLPFMAISAGPLFRFTPAISFLVACETKAEVDQYWNRLADGGIPLMPLDAYPFSEHYGWIQDRFGLSWQIMYSGANEIKQKITPVLLFVGDVYGKAGEAMRFYTSVFEAAEINNVMHYGKHEAPNKEGTVKYGAFSLGHQGFAAMDGAMEHPFTFNEAVSFIVYCKDQHEIDHYWYKLSAVPEAEQCGWLKDKFGVSWQIVPDRMDQMMADKDSKRVARVTQAFLQMKKFDLAALEKAYQGV